MTANEDELTHQIASILDKPSVYMGGPSRRSLRMAGEIVELLRSRASIGPDSERIRYKINNAIDRFVADRHPDDLNLHDPDTVKMLSRAIRDALRDPVPGTDDIVVSRDLAERLLRSAEANGYTYRHELRAALSQPHPKETP